MTSRLRLAARELLRSRPYCLLDDDKIRALRRALAEHAEEPGVPTVDECERIAFKAGVEAAAKVVADAHREINDREGTDRVTTMIIKAWLANAEIEIRALSQPAATGEGAP